MGITAKKIKSEFKKAETAFGFCWTVLIGLKSKNAGENSVDGLMDFQDRLATAIFNLQLIRDKIILEEKDYVRHKAKYKFEWFKKKLQTLSRYKEAIDNMVHIAKDLGDAFVYFFYQLEPDLLQKHLEHQEVINHTSGMGELGELAFVKNIRHLDKEFPLYHGITNILRFGDFSFVNMLTLQVTRIGELKTKKGEGEELHGTLYIIDREKVKKKEAQQRMAQEKPQDRRERQILGISKMLGSQGKDNSFEKAIVNESYAAKIGDLVRECPVNGQIARQMSPGLAFICFSFKKASLYYKLLNREIDEVKSGLEQLFLSTVPGLVKSGEARNALIIGQLLSVDKKIDLCIPGAVPLFWTNMDHTALKRIYFRDAHLVSLFNPVHLILDVEKKGFQVESKYSHKPVRSTDKLFAVIQRFDLFIGYIIRHLLTEEFVLDFMDEIQSGPYWGTNAKISMRPQQRISL